MGKRKVDAFTEKMLKGNYEAILQGLSSASLADQAVAILCVAKYKIKDDKIIEGLKGIINDEEIKIFQPQITWYAIGTLDRIGAEKYKGDNSVIIKFIKAEKIDI
jgi:hypothetical protein